MTGTMHRRRCLVPSAACLVLGAWCLLVPGALDASAQGRFTNARTETRSAAQGVDREVRAVAARGGASWVGYRVPMVAGPRQMCCYDSLSDGNACCGMCKLESGGGITMNSGDAVQRGSRITLEPPTEFLVLARLERNVVERVRTFTPDCDVDAGNMTVVWLTDVQPDDSIAWLSSLVTAADVPPERERVAKSAMHAIAMPDGPSAG